MNILIAYYSKTGATEKVALTLQHVLENEHNVSLEKLNPVKELKAYEYKKDGKGLILRQAPNDLKKFDLVVVGTPVWSFCPTPIVLSFLRNLENAKGKRVALFATCTALPGTTIQRMSSILSTKGAKVLGSLTIRSVFDLDETKLDEVREFAKELKKLLV